MFCFIFKFLNSKSALLFHFKILIQKVHFIIIKTNFSTLKSNLPITTTIIGQPSCWWRLNHLWLNNWWFAEVTRLINNCNDVCCFVAFLGQLFVLKRAVWFTFKVITNRYKRICIFTSFCVNSILIHLV